MIRLLNRLYRKSELGFALLWIGLYVVLASVADGISAELGLEKCITLPLLAGMCALLILWMGSNGQMARYGLCRPKYPARNYLYYLPLALIFSCNLWFGLGRNLSAAESILYVLSMLLVGLLEELIFRGLLFRAMEKDGLHLAVAVCSISFGLGHIVNLLNGAPLLDTLCQLCYAAAVGLLFVLMFHRGGSLVPCILAHSVNNALSAFANEAAAAPQRQIAVAIALCLLSLAYAAVLARTLGKKN